jgi:hypothetical protein
VIVISPAWAANVVPAGAPVDARVGNPPGGGGGVMVVVGGEAVVVVADTVVVDVSGAYVHVHVPLVAAVGAVVGRPGQSTVPEALQPAATARIRTTADSAARSRFTGTSSG